MLDMCVLAPHPELAFQFFGRCWGKDSRETGPGQKHTEGERKGLGDWLTLAQSSTAGPGDRVGQEAACLSLTLPVPSQGPDIQVVTSQPLQRAGRGEGRGSPGESKKGVGEEVR